MVGRVPADDTRQHSLPHEARAIIGHDKRHNAAFPTTLGQAACAVRNHLSRITAFCCRSAAVYR
eukprot:4800598-Heterocapsa_arctica.AAC.1